MIEIQDEGEIVLRVSRGGRQGITAKFYEDSRDIFTLTIQKFTTTGPSRDYHFSFVGAEINTLLQFIRNIKRFPFEDANKVNISDAEFDEIVLNSQQARRFFSENEDLFLEIAQSESLKRDVVAVGYRRAQLKRFERLLSDPAYFAAEKYRPEVNVLQSFAPRRLAAARHPRTFAPTSPIFYFKETFSRHFRISAALWSFDLDATAESARPRTRAGIDRAGSIETS